MFSKLELLIINIFPVAVILFIFAIMVGIIFSWSSPFTIGAIFLLALYVGLVTTYLIKK